MRLLLLFVFALGSFVVQAHTNCGMNISEEQQKEIIAYRQHLQQFQALTGADQRVNALITIPLQIHIVGDDNGNNYYNINNLFPQVCELNELYKDVGFYFYLLPTFDYINDSRFIRVNSQPVMGDSAFQVLGALLYSHYTYGALNVYYTSGTGLCGLAPFPSWAQYLEGRTGVLMESSKGCASPGKKTLAHELGHHFDLLHTFQGWDSGNGTTSEYVTRTAGQRNCETAGDGFCDTPADWLDYSCPYSGVKTDLKGAYYSPDVSLIMSYHGDACQYRFSSEQIAHMKAVITTDTGRVVYLKNQIDDFSQVGKSSLSAPDSNAQVAYGSPVSFQWQAADNADAYVFTITTGSGAVVWQKLVNGNSAEYTFTQQDLGRAFLWNVTPVRFNQPCTETTSNFRVRIVAPATGINSITHKEVLIYPNPVSPGAASSIQVSLPGDHALAGRNVLLTLNAVSGQQVFQKTIRVERGNTTIELPFSQLSAGIYHISLTAEDILYHAKLILQ